MLVKKSKAIAAIAKILEPLDFFERSRVVWYFQEQEFTEIKGLIAKDGQKLRRNTERTTAKSKHK